MRVSGDRRYATIAAGNISTCAVTVASTLYCWGDVVEGAGPSAQCGGGPKSGPTPCWLVPIRVSLALTGADSVLRSLSLGSHACALSTGGRTYCWGGDPFTLGVNSNTNRVPAPSPVETALRFESISVGGRRTCGLVLGGEAYCWGPSSSAFAIRSSPEAVAGGLHFQSITVGDDHTCGLTLDGKGYCWGENSLGQLGTGSRSPSSVPALILGQ